MTGTLRLAFLYPGQGAQPESPLPEMFPDMPELPELYAKAAKPWTPAVESFSQRADCDELQTQAGVLATGYALGQMLRRRGVEPQAVAGYSSGIYTALAASGAADPQDMAGIVRTAYTAILDCCPEPSYRMLAVIGLDRRRVEQLLQRQRSPGWISLANNATQVIVSLPETEAEAFSELSLQAGALRLIELPFPRPYHAPPLEPAGQALANRLTSLCLRTPTVPIMAGTEPHFLSSPEDIAETVGEQLWSPVEWEQTVNRLLDSGIDGLVCLDPSGMLTRIVLWIARKVPVYGLANPRDAARLLSEVPPVRRAAAGGP